MARALVVQPRCGDPAAVRPGLGGREAVGQHEVVPDDVGVRDPGDQGERLHQVVGAVVAPDRHEVALRVQDEPVPDPTVEVDGQAGQPQRRAGQHDAVQSAVTGGQAPRDGQLAVQPGVREQPAVRLDADQLEPGPPHVVARADLERRAVGVGPDQPHADVGQRRRPDPERHDAAAVTHHEALVAGRELPAVDLGQLGEAGGRQPAHHLGDGVERRRRDVDERAQVRPGLLDGQRRRGGGHVADASPGARPGRDSARHGD